MATTLLLGGLGLKLKSSRRESSQGPLSNIATGNATKLQIIWFLWVTHCLKPSFIIIFWIYHLVSKVYLLWINRAFQLLELSTWKSQNYFLSLRSIEIKLQSYSCRFGRKLWRYPISSIGISSLRLWFSPLYSTNSINFIFSYHDSLAIFKLDQGGQYFTSPEISCIILLQDE